MPWKRSTYPADWESVRAACLVRAASCCEGSPAYPDCRAVNHATHPVTQSRVVLTTAHLCRCVPKCGELSHLRMLYQRCHLTLDIEHHMRHAAETKRAYLEAHGQLSFLT